MRTDLTIIYYTSNREDQRFEMRIQRSLLHQARGLPLISVSQKPVDFGTNICVGEVGVNTHNALRQMQIGAIEAKTRFVCIAEADFLYPKEYFHYLPEMDDVFYLAMPLYVLFAQKGKTHVFVPKRQGSEAAMIVGRDFLVEKLKEMFSGKEEWAKIEIPHSLKYLHKHGKRLYFNTQIPTITFKTDNNMHRKTTFIHSIKLTELPGWGTAHDLLRKYI